MRYTGLMKMPYCESAVVRPEKITDYLLSAAHPNGRHKAKFFTGFGFFAADWQLLANALVEHAVEHGVANVEPSPFGIRYVIEGKVVSPDLRNPLIRAVWFIETNSNIPYFVTAYPMEGKTP